MKYDYLIVGAGLFGSVFAFLASQDGKKCLIVEKRKHVGGNLYCENIEGINVHKYGPHIFHTSNRKVWDFVNRLIEFNGYIHQPLAKFKGSYFNLPFNMNTFSQMWNVRDPEIVKEIIDLQKYEGEVHNLEEQAMSLVGKDIYETLIKGYTEKQWGRKCCELPSFIIKRLPVRFVYNNNYFNDRYQGVPVNGYNELFDKLLDGADVIQEQDYCANKEYFNSMAEKTVYTGKIDEFFDYCYGPLEYRSLCFKEEILDMPNYQGNAIVNYTDVDTPWTRIVEHKHFETFNDDVYNNSKTVITKEFSQEWTMGTEGFYPINDEKNNRRFKKYKELASKEKDVLFGGRLAEYKYYDMDKTIESAINMYQNV